MYHGIIQHKGFITEYLRDQILSRKLDQPIGHGRIYRVVHDTTQRDDSAGIVEGDAGAARRRARRIRTAGGATPRSGCWSSGATGPSSPR